MLALIGNSTAQQNDRALDKWSANRASRGTVQHRLTWSDWSTIVLTTKGTGSELREIHELNKVNVWWDGRSIGDSSAALAFLTQLKTNSDWEVIVEIPTPPTNLSKYGPQFLTECDFLHGWYLSGTWFQFQRGGRVIKTHIIRIEGTAEDGAGTSWDNLTFFCDGINLGRGKNASEKMETMQWNRGEIVLILFPKTWGISGFPEKTSHIQTFLRSLVRDKSVEVIVVEPGFGKGFFN